MKKSLLLVITLIIPLFFINCQSSDKKGSNKTQNTKTTSASLSNQEERYNQGQQQQELQEEQLLGKMLLESFIKDYGSYHTHSNLNKYLQLTGGNISYQFGRSDLVFKFGILDTDEVNAYSLPGGYVLLTRGLLARIKNESELAAVMGHEIAHINQKHIFKTVRKDREVGFAETLSSILSMGKANIGGAMNQALGESVQLLTQTGMKSEQEFEADEYGVFFATQAGYQVDDYLQLLKRLKDETAANNLSNTHPPFDQRIAKIQSLIQSQAISKDFKWDRQALDERFNLAMRKVPTQK